MKDKIQLKLDEVITKELELMTDSSKSTEDKQSSINNLSRLYGLRIEEAKVISDSEYKSNERDLKLKQIRSEATGRLIGVVVQAGLTIVGLIAYDTWYRRGLKFEEIGTISSPMTRNLISKLLPKR